MSTSSVPLSCVVIVRDAAHQIEPCLASAAFADEIVVVDSGSTDDTREVAQRLGARVIAHDWEGYGPQKRYAVAQASHDWVLCLDADERVTPALRDSIARVRAAPAHQAYRLNRCNRFLGRYLRHGEGYPDRILRLFHRAHAEWSTDLVHEKVNASCTVGDLEGDLLHESADTLAAYLDKQNRYTTLQAQIMYRAGKRFAAGQMILSPLARFVKFYLLRCGFLDGVPGLVHTAIGCANSFTKYAKLLEIERRQSPDDKN